MTANTVSKAVEKQETGPAALVRESRGWFATVVPSHIDAGAFVALAVAYLRKNPKLAEAAARNPDAFMTAPVRVRAARPRPRRHLSPGAV